MRLTFVGMRGWVAVVLCAIAGQAWGQALPGCTPVQFNGGSNDGFTVSGLWHVSSTCGAQSGAHSTPYALYYGIDGACNFNTGASNSGTADSPPMSVAPGVSILFNSRRSAETGSFDVTTVEYSIDDGGSWTTFVSSFDDGDAIPNDNQWHAVAFSLPAGATGTGTARFRFGFSTGDDISNDGFGWMIDDIQVCTVPHVAAAPIPVSDPRLLLLMAAALSLLAFGALRRRGARR
jgi:hypothetical protein